MEISGIETAKVLDATIDEAHKQGVPFHQAISMVRGATLATRGQLKEFAGIAHEARVSSGGDYYDSRPQAVLVYRSPDCYP